jgi:hypothetical protein
MSSLPPTPPKTFDDWLRAHRALLDAEKHLGNTAEKYAAGKATVEELDEANNIVNALRELVQTVFQEVIGSSIRSRMDKGS